MSRLAIQLQAERDEKTQLQNKVKEFDQREARSRIGMDNILHTNGALQSENKKVLAENEVLEREKVRRAEENATLQMESRQYVKINGELQKENALLAQHHQRSESAEQGSAAYQPLPTNQDQAQDPNVAAPNGIDNEKLPSTTLSPHNTTASSDGAQHGSIDPTGDISPINAASSSQGRLFGGLPPSRAMAYHETDDNQTPSSVVSNGTNDNGLSCDGQPTDSNNLGRGTFTSTQGVPLNGGGPLDWDHPPSRVTNRKSGSGLDVGSHKPSTSADRNEKPARGLYVPVHRRPAAETTQSPVSTSTTSAASLGLIPQEELY